jgi:Domain of unknown function (DUF4249)
MQKFTYIIFSCLILFITSCQTVIDGFDLPYQERLVVTSFISPQDTIIEVKVSKTARTTGTFFFDQPRIGFDIEGNYIPLEGVTIEMSDGQRTVIIPLSEITYPKSLGNTSQTQVQIIFAKRKGYFLKTKDFPILAGRSYSLVARANNFPTATASCIVPQRTLIPSDYQIIGGERIDSVLSGFSTIGGTSNRNYALTKPFDVLIKDYPSERNFYTVAYYTRSTFENKNPQGITNINIIAKQEPYSDFIADNRRDGQILNFIKARIPIGYTNFSEDQNFQTPKSVTLLIHLAVTDEPYYQYLKSISASDMIDNNNPFSEPVLTYTNVQGGLGVFAAFNTTAVTFELLK